MRDIIPPRARRAVYSVYASLILVLGATAVGYSSAGAALPTWHTVSTDVLVYIGGVLGLVAATNTPKGPPDGA